MTLVPAYDSGCQVVVVVDPEPAEDEADVILTIGSEDAIELTVEEARRIIVALEASLKKLEILRRPDHD